MSQTNRQADELAENLSPLAKTQLLEVASFHPEVKVTHSVDARVLPLLIRDGMLEIHRIFVPGWPGRYSYTGVTEVGLEVAEIVRADD